MHGLKIATHLLAKIQQMKSKRTKKLPGSSMKLQENHCPVPAGILVVIGGHENKGQDEPHDKKKPSDFIKLEVLQTFRDATHKRDPRVEVITTASSEPAEMFKEYQKVFEKIGITNIGQIHHTSRKDLNEDQMLERIKNADAFFFAGGDQLKLTATYGGTYFLTALKYRYINEPIVIGGTSAGAMALSTPMIYAGNEKVQEVGGDIKVTTGLEFLKDVCIDTHFINRSRLIRLAQTIVTNPTSVGIGIEEDTAIVVTKGTEMRVVGNSLVIIVDGFGITASNISEFSEDKPVTARDLKIHILSDGDLYEIPQINPPHK